MDDLFHGFEFILAYIDELLVLTKRYWTYHLHNLESTRNKLKEEMFKQEVEHLVLLVVLELANYSEWVAPSFEKPKLKSNQVHFLSEFRNLNKQLKQKQYPIPRINEMLLKL